MNADDSGFRLLGPEDDKDRLELHLPQEKLDLIEGKQTPVGVENWDNPKSTLPLERALAA